MEAEIKRDRSPKAPKLSLQESLERVKKVYQKAGKTQINKGVLAQALGYSGVSGASVTTIATLRQYGLLDSSGELLSVSPVALRLLHPVNGDQELKSRQEAALLPPVFLSLHSDGFHLADEDIISNHLIQRDFHPEGAKVVARVFKENVEFAKLNNASNNSSVGAIFDPPPLEEPAEPRETARRETVRAETGVIASYSIPLGNINEATVTIRGSETLTPEDFDALLDYVALFKKQFLRKQKSAELV